MIPALLVIDLQHWFFKIPVFSTPDGQSQLRSLISKTNELIDFFHSRKLPIVHILTIHKRDGSTRDRWSKRNDSWVLMEGSEDVQELPDIHRNETDMEIIKTRSNSFLRTELEVALRQLTVDTVVITGYSTNRCVGMTAAEACERDFDVIVSQDSILGPEQHRVDSMLSVLRNELGIEPISNGKIMDQISAPHEV
jgi:nicotinamidase-related amidase